MRHAGLAAAGVHHARVARRPVGGVIVRSVGRAVSGIESKAREVGRSAPLLSHLHPSWGSPHSQSPLHLLRLLHSPGACRPQSLSARVPRHARCRPPSRPRSPVRSLFCSSRARPAPSRVCGRAATPSRRRTTRRGSRHSTPTSRASIVVSQVGCADDGRTCRTRDARRSPRFEHTMTPRSHLPAGLRRARLALPSEGAGRPHASHTLHTRDTLHALLPHHPHPLLSALWRPGDQRYSRLGGRGAQRGGRSRQRHASGRRQRWRA